MKKNSEFYKHNLLYFFALFYHLLFTYVSFTYFLNNGGDASRYWFLTEHYSKHSFQETLFYGTNFIRFINYPLVKILGLNVQFGFLIYSLIGFLGILIFYKLTKAVVGQKLEVYNINILPLVLFLPNLNYWTSILGKEPLSFLLIVLIVYEIYKEKFLSLRMLISICLLLLIRPHMVFMIALSFFLVYFFKTKKTNKQKVITFCLISLLLLGSFYLFLQISNIREFNWEKIINFNQFSLESNQHSNSYINMIEYTWLERLFIFYFRPLFFDSSTIYSWILSLENFIWLLLHVVTLVLIIKYLKKIKFEKIILSIIVYLIVGGLLFVQRYADLGLIVRTKIMLQPFFIIVFFWVIKELKSKSV